MQEKEVKFCKKCVISNQRPRITFNEEGVCSACTYAEHKHHHTDWKRREEELKDLLDQYRCKNGRKYDVIVPCSGGKDSAIVAYKLKYKYNMHPLTVTWAPHIYSDIGWANFQSFIHSGFDNVLATPNGKVHRKLTKLAFMEMGDPFQPFIYGQYAYPFKVALQYDVKLVFYGEDGEVEYGGCMEYADRPGLDWKTFTSFRYSFLYPEHFMKKYDLSEADLMPYMPPDLDELEKRGIKQRFWSYYEKWVPQENYYYATENTGFKANPFGRSEGTYSKYASLDDRIDGFHYYMGFIKFGIGRATSDAAHEIRDGHITREEGVALVRKYDGEFPLRYFKEFLDYIDISEEQFYAAVDKFRSEHIWDKINGVWQIKTQVT